METTVVETPKAPDDQDGQGELSDGVAAGLRRFQFIEPIASPKTLVVFAENLDRDFRCSQDREWLTKTSPTVGTAARTQSTQTPRRR